MYVANRRLDLGERVAEAGEPLPEAPFWKTLPSMLASGHVKQVQDPKTLADLYSIVEQIVLPRLPEAELLEYFDGVCKRMDPQLLNQLIDASTPATLPPIAAVMQPADPIEAKGSPAPQRVSEEDVMGIGVHMHDVTPESVGLGEMVANTTTTLEEVGLTAEEARTLNAEMHLGIEVVETPVPEILAETVVLDPATLPQPTKQSDPAPAAAELTPVSPASLSCTKCIPERTFAHAQGLEMHMRAKHGS